MKGENCESKKKVCKGLPIYIVFNLNKYLIGKKILYKMLNIIHFKFLL